MLEEKREEGEEKEVEDERMEEYIGSESADDVDSEHARIGGKRRARSTHEIDMGLFHFAVAQTFQDDLCTPLCCIAS